jgi:hypothetical protein
MTSPPPKKTTRPFKLNYLKHMREDGFATLKEEIEVYPPSVGLRVAHASCLSFLVYIVLRTKPLLIPHFDLIFL